MKKIVLVLALLGSAVAINAQVKIGAKAGLNIAGVSTNDAEFNDEKKNLTSFHVGAVIDVPVTESFSFQPHLVLNGKGVGIKHEDHTDKVRFTTLDIPLNAVFRTKGGFFVGAGPNLGFNLSAKEVGEEGTTNFKFGSEAGQIKRLDFGLNFLAGFQSKSGFFASVNYLRGLSNLQNVDGFSWRNNILGISAGFLFGGKKK
jgi:hypothetical protein